MKHYLALGLSLLLSGGCAPTRSAQTADGAAPPAASGQGHPMGGGMAGAGMHGGMMHGGAQGGGMMHGSAKGGGMMAGMNGAGMMAGMQRDCPMKLEGVTVKMNEVEGGAALVFSTTGDVAELRRRVAHMAEMHEKSSGKVCPMSSGQGAANATPTP